MKKQKQLLPLLLALALTASAATACNRGNGEDRISDTDNAISDTVSESVNDTPDQTPEDTTAEVTPPVTLPPDTEPDTEVTTEDINGPTETETETEADTTPVVVLPTNPETDTDPVVPDTPAQPAEITKTVVDLSGQLVAGGAPVSGQVVSKQSDNIQLVVKYTAEAEAEGGVTLTVEVGLSCYELWCSAKKDMGQITVGGVTRTFSTDAIEHSAHTKAYIPFFTHTYYSTASSATAEVSWAFNGSYGGTTIGTLAAGVTLVFGEQFASGSGSTEPVIPDLGLPEDTEESTAPVDPSEPEDTEAPAPSDPPVPVEPLPPEETDAPVTEETVGGEEPAEPPVLDVPEDTEAETEEDTAEPLPA